MPSLANKPFLKMNGIGNEIIVLDLRGADARVEPAEARAIGQSAWAGRPLAFDQLMVLHDPETPGTMARVKIFNIDGSLSGACGNGARCVAWALAENAGTNQLTIETDAGLLECSRQGPWRFTVDMGPPRLAGADIPLHEENIDTLSVHLPDASSEIGELGPFTAVNMGNPHAVFFVADLAAHDLAALGPLIEHHPMFPQRVNVSLACVMARDFIELKVWERGAGLTLACGSAACASLVAAVRRGLVERRATIALPGGELIIEWREKDGHVLMTGDVALEFAGELHPSIFATARA